MSDPLDLTPYLHANPDGWAVAHGVRYTRATRDEVVAELDVGPGHLQGFGLVHGGVHSGLVEAVASVGAAADLIPHGLVAVGLENHTSFLHAVRSGRLVATGRPVTRGRRTQVWSVDVTDGEGRLVATGRVRLLAVPVGAEVGGDRVSLPDR